MSWQMFTHHARALGITLTPAQVAQFQRYTAMLLAANRRVNLTALRNEDALIQKFHLDALALLPVVAEHAGLTLDALLARAWRAADVGSGGGAPALPLSIAWPALHITLIESITKKAEFLAEVIDTLHLNATVQSARAEDVAQNATHRQKYDLVTARAVAALPTLVELTLPLARVGGLVVLPKGPKVYDEVDAAAHAIAVLGGELEGISSLDIPGVSEVRNVVIIRKIAETPQAYPRRVGVPKRKPLRRDL